MSIQGEVTLGGVSPVVVWRGSVPVEAPPVVTPPLVTPPVEALSARSSLMGWSAYSI